MNAARRNAAKRSWPRGLYERNNGYYFWRNAHGRQGFIGPLAGLSCDAGAVCKVSQESRSRISPALQLGEHSDGVIGWRACLGNCGIAGGGTGLGNKGGNAVAQLASNSISDNSVSTSSKNLPVSLIDNLLMCRDAALFLGSIRGFLRKRRRRGVRPVDRPSLLHFRRFLLCHFHPMRLHAHREQQRSGDSRNGGPCVAHQLGQQPCHGTIP